MYGVLLRQDENERRFVGDNAKPTPWPIALKDSSEFDEWPQLHADGDRHYDPRLDVIVHD
jgi:hypothetical protein